MNLPDSGPDPLSFELLDTRQCLAVAPQLNDFENVVFGPDFSCVYDCFRLWVESGSLFYSAVCGEAVAGRSTVLAVASVFITDTDSRDRLMRGEISDLQLAPWTPGAGSEPVAYLSSIVSANPSHLRAVYDSLATDITAFLDKHQFALPSGFCVATGPAGFRHLVKSGFVPSRAPQYLRKYDVLTIDPTTARTGFWQRVFRCAASPPRESDTTYVVLNAATSLGQRPGAEDAREIERRLNESKSARYQKLLDY